MTKHYNELGSPYTSVVYAVPFETERRGDHIVVILQTIYSGYSYIILQRFQKDEADDAAAWAKDYCDRNPTTELGSAGHDA